MTEALESYEWRLQVSIQTIGFELKKQDLPPRQRASCRPSHPTRPGTAHPLRMRDSG